MISKVYTRTGDAGQTSLVSGTRVDKDDVRVEAYGTVDELNSNLGVLLHSTKLDDHEVIAVIRKAQNKLFNIGGYLANDKADKLYGVTQEDVAELERMMDQMNEELPPAQGFVLPGGTRLSATADRCRTITRRAERRVVTLAKVAPIDPLVLEYLNRLSDFFFVFARFNNIQNQVEEIYWDKNA
ncbi:MAG: cob(I)yrinic acid a,c-diamide adenosyltransferase [Muribaculaceae bacterium]|nr:cob(I)yrinic acid a,c-diamide adenosyltransferase [Muribaculaceae bacterium]